MRKNTKKFQKIFSVMITILLVAYTLVAYLPHGHDCVDSDCIICNMADSGKDILMGAALLFIMQLLPLVTFILPAIHKRIVSLFDGTPVGLKVKLSD